MTNEKEHESPPGEGDAAVPSKRRSMKTREAYLLCTITLAMILVLSPAIDAARETQGMTQIYPMISAILPSGPTGLIVALVCAGIIGAFLTFAVCQIRRVLPRRSVWLATMLILLPLFASWVLYGVMQGQR